VTVLNHCVITDSRSPTTSRRPVRAPAQQADVRDGAQVGNFVELKKTVLGAGSKSMHLAYLGDATIGEKRQHRRRHDHVQLRRREQEQTTIEDGAFIGSDSQLIAPVTIGKGAYVGSGTTIRENVPDGALAVSAGKQRNIDGWVDEKVKSRKAKA
jgi:bifunctional UDP-N-acetylglucosamine pyrophosphorylase/glucosamine-1-phosphate N-acetyltransferase